jgi:hypothetical protein
VCHVGRVGGGALRADSLVRSMLTHLQAEPARRPHAEPARSSFMGLGDLVAYTFVGLIVAVFIFQLVDTAQTAKRKLVAKKHD